MKKFFAFLTLVCLTAFVYAQSIEDKLVDRLVEYAQIYTQSEYDVDEVPSSQCQFGLALVLADELEMLGAQDVKIDEHAYVYGTIKGNVENAPTLFLSAHLDTTPDLDLQGKAPKPQVHEYNGGDLIINKELNVVLTTEANKFLADAAGGKVITSDGTTLLGGDDKAGMSVIMTIAETLLKNPSIPHGDIRIVFTPDEEIGNSTSLLTKEKIAADFGLVLDSHGFGRIVVENFNATDFTFSVKGLSGFPGTSKRPTPYRISSNFISNFPKERAAYNSTGMDGYIDHISFKNTSDGSVVRGRLRSFSLTEMAEFKDLVKKWADETARDAIIAYEKAIQEEKEELKKLGKLEDTNLDYKKMQYVTIINGKASGEYSETSPVIIFSLKDSYFNSKNILEKYPTNYQLIEKAYKFAGVKMMPESSRGGSDACDITYMGIPTYNMFAGSHNEHSNDEWVSSKQMLASYNVALNYIQLMAEQDCVTMLKEGNPRYTQVIPTLDMKRIENIQQKVLDKYGYSFSDIK